MKVVELEHVEGMEKMEDDSLDKLSLGRIDQSPIPLDEA